MKKLFTLHIIFLVFLLLAITTEIKANEPVKITIHIFGGKNQPIKVSTTDMLSYETIFANDTLDKNGNVNLKFMISKPIYTSINIGEKRFGLFLSPNDDLKGLGDIEKPNLALQFTGKGSEANNYLIATIPIWEKFNQVGEKYWFQLESKELLQHLNSLKREFIELQTSFSSKTPFSKDFDSLLKKSNEMMFAWQKKYYLMISSNSDSLKKVEEFRNVANTIPLESSLVMANDGDYSLLLMTFLENDLIPPFFLSIPDNQKSRDSLFVILPILLEKAIKKNKYPSTIEETLLAKNIQNYMGQLGITHNTDIIYNNFIQQYQNSSYLVALSEQYNKWISISKGKLAPNFEGKTATGKTLSLNDLKGKVVYVDVWATWCGPCLEEMPFTKKLQEEFAGNNKVVFLYISVDKEQDKWHKMLVDDKLMGTHIVLQEEQIDTFYKNYQMMGIPQFFLIDQEGKIVSVKASRPSSGKVSNEILSILQK